MLNFILPGLFYIYSCKIIGKKYNPILLAASVLYILLGAALFFFANLNNI